MAKDLPQDICRDPTDLPVLGTALAGERNLLISVDRPLLDLCNVDEIAVLGPGEYWRRTR
jgi:predicted nucleic acid-binding protein